MRVFNVNGKDYTMEFSFEAAYDGHCVEDVIELLSMSDIGGDKEKIKVAYGEMPKIATRLFMFGMAEHNPITEDEAKKLVIAYIKEDMENRSFGSLVEEIVECMGDDNFLALAGIQPTESQMKKMKATQKKVPADRKRKVSHK